MLQGLATEHVQMVLISQSDEDLILQAVVQTDIPTLCLRSNPQIEELQADAIADAIMIYPCIRTSCKDGP